MKPESDEPAIVADDIGIRFLAIGSRCGEYPGIEWGEIDEVCALIVMVSNPTRLWRSSAGGLLMECRLLVGSLTWRPSSRHTVGDASSTARIAIPRPSPSRLRRWPVSV